ncbi:I78 family peptidase inhibitor [Xanthomonas bundabergensis]|uniref:I78 family peptidase inhibitor n=1 Tax=Xanthomonas bundabergensis TaxID=3160842 RepID=UPI003517D88D
MSRPLRWAAAVLPLLAACAAQAPLPTAGDGAALQGDGRCQAGPVAWAVGQAATEATLERARKASGAGQLRPIAPGQAVTRDLRPDRLNLFLDASNVIVRVSCG